MPWVDISLIKCTLEPTFLPSDCVHLNAMTSRTLRVFVGFVDKVSSGLSIPKYMKNQWSYRTWHQYGWWLGDSKKKRPTCYLESKLFQFTWIFNNRWRHEFLHAPSVQSMVLWYLKGEVFDWYTFNIQTLLSRLELFDNANRIKQMHFFRLIKRPESSIFPMEKNGANLN